MVKRPTILKEFDSLVNLPRKILFFELLTRILKPNQNP